LLFVGGYLALIVLRILWPWMLGLPLSIRIAASASAIGLTVLLGSLIAERIRDRDADRELRDEP
jgi:hypothetical protein